MKSESSEGKAEPPFGVAVQHQSIGLIDTDFHHPEALAFNRFDPSLGTLRAILISCESRAILLGSLKNHSTASERFTITVAVEVSLATPPGLPPAALQTVPSVSAMFSLPPGCSVEMPWNAGIDQKIVVLSAPQDLALFSGAGRWHVRVSTATSHAVMGGGGCIESDVRAKAACDIMVQYEFLPTRTAGRKGDAFKPGAAIGSAFDKAASRQRP